jgi:hypothetical protein
MEIHAKETYKKSGDICCNYGEYNKIWQQAVSNGETNILWNMLPLFLESVEIPTAANPSQ